MSYLVLARKYRPQFFHQVVKQEHVIQTLKNAIQSKRVPHALLFTGPRGTGKTTIARILAKAMNCKRISESEPCNECQSCIEITHGNAADVFEIDGASNNSVDQVRELRENSKYLPIHSSHKIYIIDEVHMLSTAAFNALLKTIEEPPPHILFFFATTEPHKIPITILSRCQRHDLKRVGFHDICELLKSICITEAIPIPEPSLSIIAREADGSIRDALSLLDQVMLFSQGDVTQDHVVSVLGIIDRATLFELSQAVFSQHLKDILTCLETLYYRGKDLHRLYSELIEHFRNLLFVKMGKKTKELVDLSDADMSIISNQVETISVTHLHQLIQILFQEETIIKYSSQPKIALEMVFVKMVQLSPALSIDTLIDKIDHLYQNIHKFTGQTPAVSKSAEKGENRLTDDKIYEQTTQYPTVQQNHIHANSQPSEEKSYSVPELPKDDNPKQQWWAFLTSINEKQPALSALLKQCNLKLFDGNRIELETEAQSYAQKRIIKQINILETLAKDFFHNPVTIGINEHTEKTFEKPLEKQTLKKTPQVLREKAKNHPLVAKTISVFNAKIIDIKILKEGKES